MSRETFNGYLPGELRSREVPPRKRDRGHSPVRVDVRRIGREYRFRHTLFCQCGSRFSTKSGDVGVLYTRHTRHCKEMSRTSPGIAPAGNSG